MKRILLFVLTMLAPVALAQAQAPLKMGAMVLGKVQGEDGSILGAAWVTITRQASGPLVLLGHKVS